MAEMADMVEMVEMVEMVDMDMDFSQSSNCCRLLPNWDIKVYPFDHHLRITSFASPMIWLKMNNLKTARH